MNRPRPHPAPLTAPAPDDGASFVVTGAGLVTCLGLDRHATWQAVRQGRCGIGPMTALEQRPDPDKGGGQAPDLPPDYLPSRPRQERYLSWALSEALSDAGYDAPPLTPPHRTALVLCTTLHGMRSGGAFLRSGDVARLRTFLAGSVSQHLASTLGGAGLTWTSCASCASGLAGVGLGITLLDTRRADRVIVAGYDAVSEYVYAGFDSLRLVAEGPVRPFSARREGMKVAEGYAVVVLERGEEARRRGAEALATVVGQGETSDCHHLTQPHPHGQGARRAIQDALRSAGLGPRDVGLISAHATATPDNDAAEHAALAAVFGDRFNQIPVVAFKAHVGHTLGAAGIVEMILTAMALKEQVVPSVPHVDRPEVEFKDMCLNATAGATLPSGSVALGCSLGFGGTNAAVVLAAPSRPIGRVSQPSGAAEAGPTAGLDPRRRRVEPVAPSARRWGVKITGIGVALPGAVGIEEFRRVLDAEPVTHRGTETETLDEALVDEWVRVKRARRMSPFVKLVIAAATQALQSAGFDPGKDLDPGFNAVLGTTHGSSIFCRRYYQQIVDEGIGAGNPVLFAEGVPNAGSAQLSIALGLSGGCQTLIGTRTAGLDALSVATQRIASGQWQRAVVGAAEEVDEFVFDIYRQLIGQARSKNGAGRRAHEAVFGGGAVAFVLERADSAAQRGAGPLAAVEAAAGYAGLIPVTPRSLHRARCAIAEARSGHAVGSGASMPALARLERAVLQAGRIPGSGERASSQAVTWSSIDPLWGETFSVGPLAGIGSVLVSGRLPAVGRDHGPLGSRVGGRGGGFTPATESQKISVFTAVAAGFDGAVTGVRVRLEKNTSHAGIGPA